MSVSQHLRRAGVVVMIAALIGAPVAALAGTVVLQTKYPVEGENTELFIQDDSGMPVAGATVSVVYRPGSSVEKHGEIGITNDGGHVAWTPAIAGIANLSAAWDDGAASQNVSVRFSSPPLEGILIMLLAGLLLVGGSIVRVLRIVRS